MSRFVKESELGPIVIDHLEQYGFECYQEVKHWTGRIADIVAVHHDPFLLYVLELKMSLGFAVIEQAMHWVNHAHRSYAVTPYTKQRLAMKCCEQNGVGHWSVSDNYDRPKVNERVVARLNRHANAAAHRFASKLQPEHKHTCAAGSQSGTRWTPFQATMFAVATVVADNPGITTTELVRLVKHHYRVDSTARSCIPTWVSKGKAPATTCRIENGKMRFYTDRDELQRIRVEAGFQHTLLQIR